MNYLAHIYLSGDDPQWMVGGLLGDFVKGRLKGDYPQKIEWGIALHRQIDAWVDQQPEMINAISRIPPPYRRFGGILVDVFFDHLLAANWQLFHHQSLAEYCSQFYQLLDRYQHLLPDRARYFSQRAPEVQLLENYRELSNIHQTLNRIDARLKRPANLAQAFPLLVRDQPLLEQEFFSLLPRLKQFGMQQQQLLISNPDSSLR